MQKAGSDEYVLKIKNISNKKNDFIEKYRPFIESRVSMYKKGMIQTHKEGDDDMLSIAFSAFEEAIDKYEKGKGTFFSFADLVIRSRIIDYKKRKYSSDKNVVYLEDYNSEEVNENLIEKKISLDTYNISLINESRRLEIEELSEELKDYGISFSELVDFSPKHILSKKLCRKINNIINQDKELVREVMKTKRLPIKQIELITGINRKKFERYRKYIIAVIVIKNGEYKLLKDYIT